MSLSNAEQNQTPAGGGGFRAARVDNDVFAVEGSHRLCAAYHLRMVPMIVVLEDGTEGCDSFFESVRDRLPLYSFDHVLILDLKWFER